MKNRVFKSLCIISSVLCLTLFTGMTNLKAASSPKSPPVSKPILKFDSLGNFKIVQFTDIQDGPNTDPRTLALMNKVLDNENPNLVVLTGDNIDGKCKTIEDVKTAITNIAQPMETRRIPWAIVFGNHDDEHGKMTKEQMMNFYMSFSCNVSQVGYKTNNRIGNYNLLVQGSTTTTPAFNIYMLDSGEYSIFSGYDYITTTQINWYNSTASGLKTKYKKTIPAFMFFHIPLPEYYTAYKTGLIDGVRLEAENSPRTNTGMFNTIVKNGDVKGVFVGHDHINTYTAALNGIRLGYAGNVGYATYGSASLARGARVFEINEADPSAFKTRMTFDSNVVLGQVAATKASLKK